MGRGRHSVAQGEKERLIIVDYATGIRVIDDFVDDTSELLDWLNQREWKPSTYNSLTGTAESGEHRTSSTQYFEMLGWHNPLFVHEINRNVWAALDEYATDFEFVFYSVEMVSVQRYEPGQEFKVHADHSVNNPRICSALLYLNDDFTGGETYFPHLDYAIKPEKGRLAIFPANYVYAHCSRPVLSGVKYAAAYWANG